MVLSVLRMLLSAAHAAAAATKPSCVCPANTCQDCEERCVVTAVNADGILDTDCFDDDGSCSGCQTNGCPNNDCQTCDQTDGTCDDALSQPGCVCPANTCQDCEERCMVTGVNADGTLNADCFDDDGSCSGCQTIGCPNNDCQTCDQTDGTCVDALSQPGCVCPANTCQDCEERCMVTGVNADGTLNADCFDDDFDRVGCDCAVGSTTCPESCQECFITSDGNGGTMESCDNSNCPTGDMCFDVLCYKCGNNPLSCLATGSPTAAQVTAIQAALQADCDADINQNNPRTCADQQCSTSSPGVIVNLAPNNDAGNQCLLSTGNDDPCPCIPNGLSNLGRYEVCFVSGSAVLQTATCDGNDKLCESCSVSDCPFGTLCSSTPSDCELPEGASGCTSNP
eukprot:jgi/Ulvmu1/862/UM100_0013.1